DASAWRRLEEFVVDSFVLLVADSQGTCGFAFEAGAPLVAIIADCSGFEFYVTDHENSYVIAYNDHDYLIGAGRARSWVESLGARS
ncbi:MAG: hypothetical protein AB7S26_39610, partial [Sandaracinaceae bacterium]